MMPKINSKESLQNEDSVDDDLSGGYLEEEGGDDEVTNESPLRKSNARVAQINDVPPLSLRSLSSEVKEKKDIS